MFFHDKIISFVAIRCFLFNHQILNAIMRRLKSLVLLPALLFAGCSGGESVVGEWVEPVPGMPGQVQGFTLEADGSASSVNMATLLYESWEKDGEMLVLTGKSLGNGQTIAFSDTLLIESLDKDQIVLKDRGAVRIYHRRDVADE